ncbi:MAG: asparaginase [Clostridiales bacterium]|jgi:L-asparaginase II|nr:asparaginase [Clostridiales bacterium]
MSEILVHVTRGGMMESIHRGDLAVVDTGGNLVFSIGNPQLKTYWRSAAKPFQVIPMVEAGGMERFGFTGEELAVMTSSHGGEERHVAVIQSMLNKLKRTALDLECGPSPPMYQRAANEILKAGGTFSTLTNSCSGKHCCMMALAEMRELDIAGYSQVIHPVQHETLRTVSDVTGLFPKDIQLGIDGCGVPVFGLPLYNMAIAYAHLGKPDSFPEVRKEAMGTVAAAMTANPYFVAGTGRLDTELMEVTRGRILAKLGAEGVYCLSVMGEGIGMALKIEDGNTRAIDPVIIEVLKRMNLLSAEEFDSLHERWEVKVRNHRKETVGMIKTVF